MEKTVTIKASEEEILKLINDHFDTSEDSIVALEELGNQYWYVDVSASDCDIDMIVYNGLGLRRRGIEKYCVMETLDKLCFDGILEAGEYIIDCTW